MYCESDVSTKYNETEFDNAMQFHELWKADNPRGSLAMFRNVDFSEVDFSDKNLSCVLFKNCNFTGAIFNRANCMNTTILDSNLNHSCCVKVNFTEADLRNSTFIDAVCAKSNFTDAQLNHVDFTDASLFLANFHLARLSDVTFKNSNLDYSTGLSFACTSFNINVDKRLGAQLAYHFCRLSSDDPEVIEAQHSLRKLANKFHRVKECGYIDIRKLCKRELHRIVR